MRVLLTGHNGYIGTVMAPFLAARGYEIVGLDNDLFERCTFGSEPVRFPSIHKDLRDVERTDLNGFDAVIHLAGLSNDPLGDLNPDVTYDINHSASVRLARLAKQAGIRRFLFSSSCSIYGAAGNSMLDETAEFNPVTPYGRSKVLVEQEVSHLADSEFSPTYLRNATAYGVSPRLRVDLVLNNLVAWAFTTGRILIKSDGTPWRPLVHIEDISRAFLAVLEAPIELVHDRAFNVGRNEENYQIRDVAEIVRQVVPSCRIEYAPHGGPDTRCYRVDFGRITKMLPAFKPIWDVRKGAQELCDAYRSAGLSTEVFEGPSYMRILHIQELLANGSLDSSLRWITRKMELTGKRAG
jgi:nucleoside-diphosphate-sugar epimerase